MTAPAIKLIPVAQAAKIAGRIKADGSPNVAALRAFVTRWNVAHPDAQIATIKGAVDEHGLRAAIRKAVRAHTPGGGMGDAARHLAFGTPARRAA